MTSPEPTAGPARASGPGGVIHDIGYRHYSGERLERRYITRSLFTSSLRGAFGLGRSGRSKILPMLLAGAMVGTAVVIVAVINIGSLDSQPLPYSRFPLALQLVIAIFLAAQSPQLVSRDLRFRTITLYFARPLERIDYVTAKYAAMAAALYIITGLPLVVLYLGGLLAGLPFGRQTAEFAGGMLGLIVLSFLLAGIGLVFAALTPRRGFAVALVIVVVFLSYGAVNIVAAVAVGGGRPGPRRLGRPALADDALRRRPGLAVRGRVQRRRGAARARSAASSTAWSRSGASSARSASCWPATAGWPRHEHHTKSLAPRAIPGGPRMSVLEIAGVSRWFGNVVAVNDVTMTIGPASPGSSVPNGAGKSTLISMMAGFLAPSAGSVTLDGVPTWRNEDIYRLIGLVPEREGMYDGLSGWQFVLANARLHGLADPDAAAHRAISTVEMDEARDRDLGTYSKGMKQRIKMAAALVHDPAVLLLDEPFNGMDPRQRLHLMDLLRATAAAGRTVLFSSHILEEVEVLASHIEVVVAGRHAASGDFRRIRRLMTDRPHQYVLRSSDDRALAAAIIADRSATSVELDPIQQVLMVQAIDFERFTTLLPRVAREADVRLFEVRPSDESLESVFSYLVSAR